MGRKGGRIAQPLKPEEDSEKEKSQHSSRANLPPLKLVVLRPVGYPLRALGDDRPIMVTTDNMKLFQAYARDQWMGFRVTEGDFLFDQLMFPDFAFEVVKARPRTGRVTSKTIFKLESPLSTPFKKEFPKVKFSDIVGHEHAKSKCKIVLKYLKNPKLFGEWAPRNILFYGPPGTGKTMMAKALASEADCPIFLTRATDLIGTHVGDGAKRIHQLFNEARRSAPSVIFIDELDAIGLDRKYQSIRGDVSEVVNALLSELDGLSPNTGVVTIMATNAPLLLDRALRSRFEEEILFPLPTLQERYEILKMYAAKMPLPVVGDLMKIAKETEGFSGRDLKEKVLKTALHFAILEDAKEVRDEHLQKAVERAKSTIRNQPPTLMFV
ncbi:MAG: AAA family ATPase [Candidatus Baldrarchaeia archaeon]